MASSPIEASSGNCCICHDLRSYTVMPFGLRNASTFQRLMNKVVAGLEGFAVYLDDVIIYSNTWIKHVDQICDLFYSLATSHLAMFMVKFGHARGTVTYLGKVVGQGQVLPVRANCLVIDDFPPSATKEPMPFFWALMVITGDSERTSLEWWPLWLTC